MKVLLTHRYFWPDTAPYALMLRSIGDGLADAGYDVHVFASRPSYRGGQTAPKVERLGALQVRRCFVLTENRANPALRAVNVMLYCIALFVHVLRLRPDVVTASTFPPVLAGWTASLAARIAGARFVYHCQDIHPEVSLLSGGRLGRGWPFRLLRWLDNQTLRRADTVVVLSQDMARTLRTRAAEGLNIRVVNNFMLETFDTAEPPPQDLRKPGGVRRVIFAGNLGRYQNLPLLVEGVALSLGRWPDLELLLLGDGEMLDRLKRDWASHPRIRFAPFMPFSQARQIIADADVGLVSLMPDIYRVSYPSKVLSYTGMGLPILVLVEPDSDLARDIVDAQIGVVPEDPSPQAISTALDAILAKGVATDAVLGWYESVAGRSRIMANWRDIVSG